MTRKWSWRHRKFHKIRYLGFLKKLTRCEYELSRPSRSRETAADVMRFHFSQIFFLCLFWFLSVTQSYFHGLKSTQINVKMALLESFWFFTCTAEKIYKNQHLSVIKFKIFWLKISEAKWRTEILYMKFASERVFLKSTDAIFSRHLFRTIW